MAEADLRERTLSAANGWGPSVAQNFHFGRPKINLSGFQIVSEKKKKKKKGPPHLHGTNGALSTFKLVYGALVQLLLFRWGPDLFYGGPKLRGPLSAAADTADSKICHWPMENSVESLTDEVLVAAVPAVF